jgi:ABC-type Mn2+/Zn2+ transport system ATPase subunit
MYTWAGSNAPTKSDLKIADQMIDRMGLAALADRQIGQLSGGQQQRALLARALTQQADLLLLDEPLNAVDATTRNIIADVLTQLKHEGKAVIAATHDLGRLETDFDGALYLTDGREVPPPTRIIYRYESATTSNCQSVLHV